MKPSKMCYTLTENKIEKKCSVVNRIIYFSTFERAPDYLYEDRDRHQNPREVVKGSGNMTRKKW